MSSEQRPTILLVSEGAHEGRTPQEIQDSKDEDSALSSIVRRILKRQVKFLWKKTSSHEVRTHGVRGTGFKKRALAWMRFGTEMNAIAVVFLIDEDGNRSRIKEIDEAQEAPIPAVPRALGVAVRTFDAWMLADETAWTKVLKSEVPVPCQKDPEADGDPKQTCEGLLAAGTIQMRPRDAYRLLAQTMDLEVLEKRCQIGFGPFATRVRALFPSPSPTALA